MPKDTLTLENLTAMAAEIGLTRLGEEHLQQLLRVTNAIRRLGPLLPAADLTPADEPAMAFSTGPCTLREAST
jgi:hypothetical protein